MNEERFASLWLTPWWALCWFECDAAFDHQREPGLNKCSYTDESIDSSLVCWAPLGATTIWLVLLKAILASSTLKKKTTQQFNLERQTANLFAVWLHLTLCAARGFSVQFVNNAFQTGLLQFKSSSLHKPEKRSIMCFIRSMKWSGCQDVFSCISISVAWGLKIKQCTLFLLW